MLLRDAAVPAEGGVQGLRRYAGHVPKQPDSALAMPLTISSIATRPSPPLSAAPHIAIRCRSSARSTIATSSDTRTVPSPLQSPEHISDWCEIVDAPCRA